MLHIYGRIERMYLGSDFHRFWARCGRHQIHPDDAAYLKHSPFDHGVLPCPFDGPLNAAKVVICLANPSYGDVADAADLNDLVMSMRSGEEALPEQFDDFYRRITKPIGLPLDELRRVVSVFNVCPYPSARMADHAIRVAAGLPSVWHAQKFLREVLIPRAQTGNIYLLLIRKLQLWGVTDGADRVGHLKVVRDRAIDGVMPTTLGKEMGEWLVKKRYVLENHSERV